MSKTDGEQFRNALGGYNKEDVNRYIKETDLAFTARLDTMQKQLDAAADNAADANGKIEALQKKVEECTAQLAQAASQLSEKEMQCSQKDATLQELQKRLDIARAQTDAQNAVMEKLKKENAALTETLKTKAAEMEEAQEQVSRALREKEEAIAACAEAEKSVQTAVHTETEKWQLLLRNAVAEEKEKSEAEIARLRKEFDSGEESVAYRLRMYDKISGQVGDILLNANRNADDVLAAAHAESEKIRSDAMEAAEQIQNDAYAKAERTRAETEEEAVYIRERLSDTAEQLLAIISGNLHDNVGSCIREVDTCIAEMQSDMNTTLNTIQARYREMSDRILYYQNCVTDTVEKKLREMDEKYGIAPGNAPIK